MWSKHVILWIKMQDFGFSFGIVFQWTGFNLRSSNFNVEYNFDESFDNVGNSCWKMSITHFALIENLKTGHCDGVDER